MLAFNTREEFLNSRRGKIGASDAPKIMGECPHTTPYKLWRLKLGIDVPDDIKPHMQAGLDIEEEAREWFHHKTKKYVQPYQIHHPVIDYMIASLDGISDDKTTILEIKRPNINDHEFAKKTGMPPKKYWIQIQHQLECTYLNFGYYLSYYKNDPVLLIVKRDQDFIKNLIGREAEFFHMMTNLVEPELIDADYEKKDDEEWNFTSCEIREYKDKIKDLEKKLEISENKLIHLSKGKNCEGNGVRIRQVVRKGNIDYTAIPDLKIIDLEKYRKEPKTYWTIKTYR